MNNLSKRWRSRLGRVMRALRDPGEPCPTWTAYSQEGEDLILAGLFAGLVGERQGFYVDVGAHHPWRISNTYFFYIRGWKGVNIDPMPGCMDLFKKHRQRDINLQMAIGRASGIQSLKIFEASELNTLIGGTSSLRVAEGTSPLIAEVDVQVHPLRDILETHVPQGQRIDFLTIDVEGMDFDVLQSSDWTRHRPTVVLVEDLDRGQSPIWQFLNDQGYEFFAKTRLTSFFVESDAIVHSSIGVQLREEVDRIARARGRQAEHYNNLS